MVIKAFPSPDTADEYGLVAIGGDLDVESLVLAYSSGIFPWPVADEAVLTWFSPPERAVLFLDRVRVSKSLGKEFQQTTLKFFIDKDTEKVIQECASLTNRKEDGTWITNEIRKAYVAFHKAGYCHSVSCYDGEELVGGLYGVSINGMFAGESLFYRKPNASKLCLLYLIEYLRQKGVRWIDCQQMTPLLESFGAVELSREEFLDMLEQEVSKDISLF